MPSPKLSSLLAVVLVSLTAACGHPALMDGSAPTGPMSPKVLQAALASGDAAISAGQPLMAANFYARAYASSPSAAAATDWARALRIAGKYEEAVVTIQSVIGHFPNDVELQTELGRCAAAGGYVPEATAAFSRAEALPGVAWPTYMADGSFLAMNGHTAEAAAQFKQAEATARSLNETYSARANTAMLRAQEGDLAGALSDMEEVASHPGVDPKVHADLALLYGLSGNMDGYHHEMAEAGVDPAAAAPINQWMAGEETAAVSKPTRPGILRVSRPTSQATEPVEAGKP